MANVSELGHGEHQDEATHFITEGAKIPQDLKCSDYT